ncbi:hypothetical protein ACIA8E_41660 [Streptomyces sp. NPDC051664]|uniref:hypothetical protein n=1 Tax=Streptomyces sp. NPDC051664 TaxID=3365668 RepID=UPI0037A2705E
MLIADLIAADPTIRNSDDLVRIVCKKNPLAEVTMNDRAEMRVVIASQPPNMPITPQSLSHTWLRYKAGPSLKGEGAIVRNWMDSSFAKKKIATTAVYEPDQPWNISHETDLIRKAPWIAVNNAKPFMVLLREATMDEVHVGVPSMAESAQSSSNDREIALSHAEFAELLACDPEFDTLPKDAPIVLAGHYTGDFGLALPRVVADRTGHTVWSYSSSISLRLAGNNGWYLLSPSLDDVDREGDGVGRWLWDTPAPHLGPSTEAEVTGLDMHGVPFTVPETLIRWQTLQDSHGNQIGRASLPTREWAIRDFHYSGLADNSEFYRFVRNGENREIIANSARPVPWAGKKKPHFVALHGSPTAVGLELNDGRIMTTRGDDFAKVLRRRRSVKNLAADVPLILLSCETAAKLSNLDPDRMVNVAQQVSYTTGRVVYAPDQTVATAACPDPHNSRFKLSRLGIFDGPDGRPGEFVTLRPFRPDTDVIFDSEDGSITSATEENIRLVAQDLIIHLKNERLPRGSRIEVTAIGFDSTSPTDHQTESVQKRTKIALTLFGAELRSLDETNRVLGRLTLDYRMRSMTRDRQDSNFTGRVILKIRVHEQ